jgi:hypothetical protein
VERERDLAGPGRPAGGLDSERPDHGPALGVRAMRQAGALSAAGAAASRSPSLEFNSCMDAPRAGL